LSGTFTSPTRNSRITSRRPYSHCTTSMQSTSRNSLNAGKNQLTSSHPTSRTLQINSTVLSQISPSEWTFGKQLEMHKTASLKYRVSNKCPFSQKSPVSTSAECLRPELTLKLSPNSSTNILNCHQLMPIN
jgi:hypothetical protein